MAIAFLQNARLRWRRSLEDFSLNAFAIAIVYMGCIIGMR